MTQNQSALLLTTANPHTKCKELLLDGANMPAQLSTTVKHVHAVMSRRTVQGQAQAHDLQGQG